MPDYHLSETIGFQIHRAAMELKAAFNREMQPRGITAEQFGILASLWQEDGLPPWQLAEQLYKDRPNITRMVDRLEQKGMVRREPDPADGRRWRVRLTEAGRSLQQPLLEQVAVFRDRVYDGLSEDEQRLLKEMLNRITHNLDQGGFHAVPR